MNDPRRSLERNANGAIMISSQEDGAVYQCSNYEQIKSHIEKFISHPQSTSSSGTNQRRQTVSSDKKKIGGAYVSNQRNNYMVTASMSSEAQGSRNTQSQK